MTGKIDEASSGSIGSLLGMATAEAILRGMASKDERKCIELLQSAIRTLHRTVGRAVLEAGDAGAVCAYIMVSEYIVHEGDFDKAAKCVASVVEEKRKQLEGLLDGGEVVVHEVEEGTYAAGIVIPGSQGKPS